MNKKRRRVLMEILADYLYLVGGADENRAKRFAAATAELNKLIVEEKAYQKKFVAPKEGQ